MITILANAEERTALSPVHRWYRWCISVLKYTVISMNWH